MPTRIRAVRIGTSILVAAAAALALALAATPPPAVAAACPNEAIRAEQGATTLALPECRAYELVSPGSIPLVAINGQVPFGVRAAVGGDALAFYSYYPLAGAASSGFFNRAVRGAAGWSVQAMVPPIGPEVGGDFGCTPALNYSEDLSQSVLRIGGNLAEEKPSEAKCAEPQAELAPGAPAGYANLYLQESPDGAYRLLNGPPPGAVPANGQFQDGSADLSHVVFGENAQLTAEAPPGYNLYEWVGGTVRLVSFLPDGVPVRGDLAGAGQHRRREGSLEIYEGGSNTGSAPFTNAVSRDGEMVFFYADGNLYLRENAGQPPTASGQCSEAEPSRACTLQIDASRGLGPGGGGVFLDAGTDGERVFFSDESELTFPSSAEPGKPDLYEYDLAGEELTDLTGAGEEAADVRGFSGASEDGAYLYFVARGALTGERANSQGAVAQPREPNLYLAHDGTLTYVATLAPYVQIGEDVKNPDFGAWGEELKAQESGSPVKVGGASLATRTAPDGGFLAFNSVRALTGVGAGSRQVFIYDAATGQLSCVSCLPGGAAPPGPTSIPEPINTSEAIGTPGYLPRSLTDRGQLFFTSDQQLLPADTDGVADVYEYDAGALRLFSDGAGAGPSYLFDASAGGNDVFFATTDPLVRADTDNSLSLYDARVDGGFPEPPSPAAPCEGGACRGAAAAAPSPAATGTTTFVGPGNRGRGHRCRKGSVRRHGRCVKKHHTRHRRHRHHTHHKRHRGKHGRRRSGEKGGGNR